MAKENNQSSRESSIASGWTVEGQAPEAVPQTANVEGASVENEEASLQIAQQKQLSSGALVLLGVIGGIYLLYTFVWFSWSNAVATSNSATADMSGSLGGVLQQTVVWVAPFAPALWFVSVLVLCAQRTLLRKMIWLLVGLVLLLPLPMFGGLFS